MIPIVKLVFGATYDKTRLTEYAAALDHALANMLESHALAAYLEQYAGGLKGLVRDMRQARRKEKPAAASRTDAARKKLRSKVALKPEEVPTDEHGFAIMVGRREADGRSEEHTSELQSLMRISYAVFCLKKKKHKPTYD